MKKKIEDNNSESADTPILIIHNDHVKQCGEPPHIDDSIINNYIGYYANDYGEQMIFTYDRTTKKATLRHGDCGWDNTYSVVDGLVPEIVLNNKEKMWLLLCWLTATGSSGSKWGI